MCTTVYNILTWALLTIIVLAISNCTTQDNRRPSGSSNYGRQLEVRQEPDVIMFPSNTNLESSSNNYQHYHHHHHHDFHHHHHPHDHVFLTENSGEENSEESSEENAGENSSLIPLDLILKLNNFTDLNDLLLNLVEGDMEEEQYIANRFGEGERSAAIVPKAAACMPELQTVKITSDDDPSILYIPSCTRIERCGGCCSHSLLKCQPKDLETVSYQVVKTQFVGGSKLKFIGKEVVLVEKHNKCKCDCKVQEKDCNSFQEYRKSECRCACTNTDEEKKCYKENATKLWNPEICSCECRNILLCSTGYTYDTFRCRCMTGLVRRRFAELQESETSSKSEALPTHEMENTMT